MSMQRNVLNNNLWLQWPFTRKTLRYFRCLCWLKHYKGSALFCCLTYFLKIYITLCDSTVKNPEPLLLNELTQTSCLNFKAIYKVVLNTLQPDSSVYSSVPITKMAKLWARPAPTSRPFLSFWTFIWKLIFLLFPLTFHACSSKTSTNLTSSFSHSLKSRFHINLSSPWTCTGCIANIILFHDTSFFSPIRW